MGGTTDRAAIRKTQHGNHATLMCPISHRATMYIQQTVLVTQRHSYLHQSRHRDSITASLQAAIRLFNAARHPTANVTHHHSYSPDLQLDMVKAILQLAQQLWRTVTANIFILVTASLALLGSEIPSRQAISIQKRKFLIVSPLTALGCSSGSTCDIAISSSPSRHVRNGSLLTLSNSHLLALLGLHLVARV